MSDYLDHLVKILPPAIAAPIALALSIFIGIGFYWHIADQRVEETAVEAQIQKVEARASTSVELLRKDVLENQGDILDNQAAIKASNEELVRRIDRLETKLDRLLAR